MDRQKRSIDTTACKGGVFNIAGRRGKKRDLVTVGHQILIEVYRVLETGDRYQDAGAAAVTERRLQNREQWIIVTLYGGYKEEHKVVVEPLMGWLDESGQNVPIPRGIGRSRFGSSECVTYIGLWKCLISEHRFRGCVSFIRNDFSDLIILPKVTKKNRCDLLYSLFCSR